MLVALAFSTAMVASARPARCEDSRLEKARQIRDELLQRRREPPAASARSDGPVVVPAAVAAAEEHLATIDADIEAARAKVDALAAPRDQLVRRSDELARAAAKMREENRATVAAIYRSAKLGAGVAGWHADPGSRRRLSRYLASVASARHAGLSVVEVEQGSVIAALDKARSEEAAAVEQIRMLEADRIDAETALARAMEGEMPNVGPVVAADDARGRDEDAPSLEGRGAAQAADLALAKLADAIGEPAGGARDAATAAAEPTQAAEATAPADGDVRPGTGDDTDATEGAADGDGGHVAKDVAADDGKPSAAGEDVATAGGPDEDAGGVVEDGPSVLAPASDAGEAAAKDLAKAEGEDPDSPRRRSFLSRMFGSEDESDSFAAARGSMPAPVAGKVVANYGQQHKSGATYRGAILRASHSAPVRSVAAGRVSFAGMVAGLGNTVIVSHGSRYHTVYARLGSLAVKEGDRVDRGSRLGALPDDNPDMHFELRDRGKAIDPIPWLKAGIPGAAR